jgi:hypothetical protein
MPRTPSPRRSAKREEREDKKLSDNVRAGLRKGRIHSRVGRAGEARAGDMWTGGAYFGYDAARVLFLYSRAMAGDPTLTLWPSRCGHDETDVAERLCKMHARLAYRSFNVLVLRLPH